MLRTAPRASRAQRATHRAALCARCSYGSGEDEGRTDALDVARLFSAAGGGGGGRRRSSLGGAPARFAELAASPMDEDAIDSIFDALPGDGLPMGLSMEVALGDLAALTATLTPTQPES